MRFFTQYPKWDFVSFEILFDFSKCNNECRGRMTVSHARIDNIVVLTWILSLSRKKTMICDIAKLSVSLPVELFRKEY